MSIKKSVFLQEVEAARASYGEMTTKLGRLQCKVDLAIESNHSLRSQLVSQSEVQAQLQVRLEEASGRCTIAETAREQLEAKCSSLSEAAEILTAKVVTLNSQLHERAMALEQMQFSLTAATENAEVIEEELLEKERELDVSKAQLRELANLVTQAREEEAREADRGRQREADLDGQLKALQASAENQSAEHHTAVTELQARIASATVQVDELRACLVEAQAREADLQKIVQTSRIDNENLNRAQLASAEQLLQLEASQRARLDETHGHLLAAREAFAQASQELTESKQQTSLLQSSLDTTIVRLVVTEKELVDARAMAQEQSGGAAELLAQKQQRLMVAEAEQLQLHTDLLAALDTHSQLTRENAELARSLDREHSELARETERGNVLEALNSELRAEAGELNEELLTLQSEHRSHADEAGAHTEELEARLAAALSDLASLRAANLQAQTEGNLHSLVHRANQETLAAREEVLREREGVLGGFASLIFKIIEIPCVLSM